MAHKIGTHNGNFHCDEALACFMLKKLPEYSDSEIVRTRDTATLEKCNIVVDVGGVYDHHKMRYDHHQREFKDTMKSLDILPKFTTKLSSAGLVYAHYGRRVIGVILGVPNEDPCLDVLFEKVYESFIEEVDAGDNGIPPFDGTPRYHVSTTLAARVGHLNPPWNDEHKNYDEGFKKAFELVGTELTDRVKYYYKSWLPAREVVLKALNERFEVDEGGKVLMFADGGAPWKEHFFQLEEDLELQDERITYVTYPDDSGMWRIQAIPVNKLQGFESRLPLPEKWRGVRDADLEAVCGISGATFCHASGFIGGNKTREGALSMARKSLELAGQ
uniref:Uncharacterized protein n=1 Tax=Plectus sambesii TaxID=2011161 RepID=A0A914V847_9BILA